MDIIYQTWHKLLLLMLSLFDQGIGAFILKFFPFVLLFELPLYILIFLGVFRYFLRKDDTIPENRLYYPSVSCIVLCYSEGNDIKQNNAY